MDRAMPLPKPEPVWIPYNGLAFPERAFILGYVTPLGPVLDASPLQYDADAAVVISRLGAA